MNNETLQKLQIVAKYLAYVVVAIALFFLSYNFFSKTSYSGYDKVLVNNISKIQKINDRCKDFTTSNSIDKEKALKKITAINSDLTAIKNDLTANPPTDNSNKNYVNLLKGLDSNILIIQQIEAMLNNPSGKDIEKAGRSLISYKETANNHYSLISLKNINFSIGRQLTTTIDNTLNYCLSSNNLKRGTEIKLEQLNGFITELDELSKHFENYKIDYYPEALKARSKEKSYELIISDIDKTITSLNNLRNSLDGMVIPNDGLTLYNEFKTIINTYLDYLNNIKYSIATENVKNSNENSSEDLLESLYITPRKLFSEVEVSYKNFLEKYNKFKDNN